MKEKIIIATELVETSPQALPLGAACIVSSLKSHPLIANHYDVLLQDFSAEDFLPTDDIKTKANFIAKQIANLKPCIVGLSIFVWNHLVMDEVANLLKQILPEVFLIAGGPEVTANPICFKKNFDFIICGAGEEKIINLVLSIMNKNNTIQNGSSQFSQTDLTRTKNSFLDITQNTNTKYLTSPYLDGTLNIKKYGGVLWELARGCPFKCSYCYESKGQKTIQHFPMDRLKNELSFFKKNKVTQIFVLDPTYNADKERAMILLDFIKKTAPDIFFHFEVRSEFLDEQMVKKFSRLNCSLQIGLQSANNQVLKNVNRSFNKKEFSKKIDLLNQNGVTFGLDLIFGLPGDTLTIFKQSIDYSISLYPNHLEVFRLSVLPGTALYDEASKFGLNFTKQSPYYITSTPTYTEEDILLAEKIANAVGIFYTCGRAVSWFNTIIYPTKIKPSTFFELFADFLDELKINNVKLSQKEIQKLQIDFIKKIYKEKKLTHLLNVAMDLININSAYNNAYADGKTSIINLHYFPEDLLSPYTLDIQQFYKYAQKHNCKIQVYLGKNGVDFKNV